MSENEEAKRVNFYVNKDAHIRFRASLEKHNMTMSEFFRACCDAVTNDNDQMIAFLNFHKESSEQIRIVKKETLSYRI